MSIFLLNFIKITLTFTIHCTYSTNGQWWVVNDFYYCTVSNKLGIESPDNTTITSVVGEHTSESFSLDDVGGFEAENADIRYFPKGLDKIFGNLVMIDINYGPLKEIHQSDLQPFPKLKCLELYQNEIEVLEDGLFKFNTELEMIWLSSNRIFHIDPEVFDGLLGQLSYLSLDTNECISEYVTNSTEKVFELVTNVTKKCVDPKVYMSKILAKIDHLEVKFEIFVRNAMVNERREEKPINDGHFWIISVLILIILSLCGVIWWRFYVNRPKFTSKTIFINPKYDDGN